MSNFKTTDRTQVRRLAKRGNYDREIVYKILDEAMICHVGFVIDGQPYVIPTGYGRSGDTLYIHGASTSRMLNSASQGIPVCITVTLVDGLVLARSTFHHSMNYRSVVILGTARHVESDEEKLAALRTFTEHIVPGRWADVRQPTPQEMKATAVLVLPLEEVSAKIRTGPPIDDEADYALPIWAGILPLRLTPGLVESDPRLTQKLDVPPYVKNYQRA